MLKIFNPKGFLMKAGPVIFAAVVAIGQAISEQREAERMDDMEERLRKLEEDEENEDDEDDEESE